MFILPFWFIAGVVILGCEAMMWGWIETPGTMEKTEAPLKTFVVIVLFLFLPITAVVAIAASISKSRAQN